MEDFEDGLLSTEENDLTGDPQSIQENERSRIIRIGHLPHGFFEDQLSAYLSQFGTVANVVVPRSRKTNRDKGYALVAFESPDVAEVVVQTLHNFLLMKKRLICRLIPAQQINYQQFLRRESHSPAVVDSYKTATSHSLSHARQINKVRTGEEEQVRLQRLSKKDAKKRALFNRLGIEYTFKGYDEMSAIPKTGYSGDDPQANTPAQSRTTKRSKATTKSTKRRKIQEA
jgi:nucleolar protein 15